MACAMQPFPPALREIGREVQAHDRAKPKRAPCAPLCYCAGARAARTPSWPLQAGTPLRVSGDAKRCAYGVTRHPPLRAFRSNR